MTDPPPAEPAPELLTRVAATRSVQEQAAAVLAQHLHHMGRDAPVHWEITSPFSDIPHTGHLRLNGLPDDGFIADAVAEVTQDLTATAAARRAGTRP